MDNAQSTGESRPAPTEHETLLDFDALNRGIQIAARLMLDEGITSGQALVRGWRSVGIDYASVPNDLKKYPSMFLSGAVERARREGVPVRAGALIPVQPPDSDEASDERR